MSDSWEDKFPNSTLSSLLRVGSDHTPLFLDNGEDLVKRPSYFRFESAWLFTEGFREMVMNKMIPIDNSYILDFWNRKQSELRKFLKGYGLNSIRERDMIK